MKKFMIVGDIHGRTCWKVFADIKFLLCAEPDAAGFGAFVPEYEKYIFVGDYTDSFTVTNDVIRENLIELIRFKTLYPNHVILLWGNHDVEYWRNLPWIKGVVPISGFRYEMHYDLYEIFNKNFEKFQLAFQYKNYLFSHAGVHFGWYHYVFTKAIKGMGMEDKTVAEQLNEAFLHRLPCLFDIDWYRGGNKKVGGPLWCDKQLMSKKPLKHMHQIVGHTATDEIKIFKKNDSTSVVFCDILHNKKEFYSIEI